MTIFEEPDASTEYYWHQVEVFTGVDGRC